MAKGFSFDDLSPEELQVAKSEAAKEVAHGLEVAILSITELGNSGIMDQLFDVLAHNIGNLYRRLQIEGIPAEHAAAIIAGLSFGRAAGK